MGRRGCARHFHRRRYGRALDAPFILDDESAIVKNPSIISLWPLVGTAEQPGPFRPPPNLPTVARPLVNLSFAVNYRFGGLNPAGYHAVNVLIHFLSALLLWAIVRRTLRLPYFSGRFTAAAGWLALAVALLWALHPLQTEAVIYATQRTELLMAFFYLATLYCSLRYWETEEHPRRRTTWLTLAVVACLCGMASKEVMVSAPLIVLLFERTFIAGSLAGTLRRSWPLYAGLASTWIVLLALNLARPRRLGRLPLGRAPARLVVHAVPSAIDVPEARDLALTAAASLSTALFEHNC